LLIVTCGILYGAYRGYQFFDAKFGTDRHAGEMASEVPPTAPVPPVIEPLVKSAAVDRPSPRKTSPDPSVTLQADAITEPVPRARIVR
jgi:hypothetical protein